MKQIKSNSFKVLFVIVLLCPAVFADGDMGSGGFTASDLPLTTAKTCRTLEDGDMGSGGGLANDAENGTSLDTVLSSIYEYLDWMI